MNMPNSDLETWLNNNEAVLEKQYEKPNYHIRYCNPKSKVCFMFFSSNGIYFPNTESEFTKQIRDNDRYEWINITNSRIFQKKCAKIIFLRDIYKQWYVTGINQSLNTIEKLVPLLKKETEGYTVITAGSSSGGYAAVLFGILLQAEKIFSFSGQFVLSDIEENPLLKKYINNTIYNQYYNLVDFCKFSQTPIFYFYPALCEYDRTQAQAVATAEGKQVYAYRIESAVHGNTLLSQNYRFLFFKKEKSLFKLYMRFKGKNVTAERFLMASCLPYAAYFFLKNIVHRKFALVLKKL